MGDPAARHLVEAALLQHLHISPAGICYARRAAASGWLDGVPSIACTFDAVIKIKLKIWRRATAIP